MSFMEPQIVHGSWYEIDGPMGTEYVRAELAGWVDMTIEGKQTARRPTLEDLQAYDREMGIETESEDETRFPIPSTLKQYCENSVAWSIKLITGYGARLSAPGYLDCTAWSVFETEAEAEAHLRGMEDDE